MNLFQRYKAHVFRTIGHDPTAEPGLDHWRDKVFGTVLTYALPLSLLALVPSIRALWMDGLYVLATYDIVALLFLVFITLVPGISIEVRKGICISLLYGIAVALLYFLGNQAPGLLFMVAASVFSILFYRLRYAILFQLLSVAICLGFLWLIHHADPSLPIRANNTGASWMAISSNMIFVSAILVLLLHHILNGLEQALREQQRLRDAAEQANVQLGQVNQELEEFAYVASHDLQEPLRMVTGFLDLLRRRLGTSLDERSIEYMDLAQDGAKRMRTNIDELLGFARAGRSNETPTRVDISSLIHGLRRDLGPNMESTGAQLHYEGPDSMVIAKATLRQVLINLVGNGLKYQPSGRRPEVSVTAAIEAAMAHFAVRDNGIGIDPKDHERIFRMMQRLHARDEYAGTGMGLAICKKVVERAGGSIWVRSSIGSGSTFHFTLPVQQAATTSAPVPPSREPRQ